MDPVEEAEARAHIAKVAESQRAARGTIEHVSMPWLRKRGRALLQVWIWISKIAGMVWRRIVDSHRWPGRVFRRLSLIRVTTTLSFWMVAWFVIAGIAGYLVYTEPTDNAQKWLANWALGGAVGAFFAVVWHDLIKSPHTMRRIRRRIVDEAEALLRATLAEQATTVVELDPPVNTVHRDELYDELLPGALARKKDVQIVVGDPGAGKTTALVDLASVLAKIGLMPVLLEMRGESKADELIDRARARFGQLVRPYVKTDADAEIVWRWLCERHRVAILVDDIDQIGFDGEPGFVMRRLLENAATEGQAVIVTARPAGVPAGIAASAIPIEPLGFKTAVDLAAQPSKERGPVAVTDSPPPREEIERWVREGNLTEAPLYLEALAELTSVDACPDLPDDPERWEGAERPGRWREVALGEHRWNRLWVRYMLLERFYAGIVEGKVRGSLAIDRFDRERSVEALEGAALGTLGATAREAIAAAKYAGEPQKIQEKGPKRWKLVDFISTDDRGGTEPDVPERELRKRRLRVSQHEAIDTCERLRILAPDHDGEPQFRHRIMQAFLAGRCLAELGRLERENKVPAGAGGGHRNCGIESFDSWVEALMDKHHPEKLTAHLTLTFAAIHADAQSIRTQSPQGDGLADEIVCRLVRKVRESVEASKEGKARVSLARQLDPMQAPDPHERTDPDDDLIKLTTAANLATLLRRGGGRQGWPAKGTKAKLTAALCAHKRPDPIKHAEQITKLVKSRVVGAMRWTKLQAVPAIAGLGGEDAWMTIWKQFTGDDDYDVRRTASKELDQNAWNAYPELQEQIQCSILRAGYRASMGKGLKFEDTEDAMSKESFEALGWVLPAIVSGLSEEGEGQEEVSKSNPQNSLDGARAQLGMFATLAFEGGRPALEDSLAQGFKADAMCHASDPTGKFKGPGWVTSNRRLAADIALPKAESWYARMLLYQALALYAITGANRDDTMDILANRLHRTRERHPMARRAAKLARRALRHARFKGSRWEAFIWSDDVEGSGRLPGGPQSRHRSAGRRRHRPRRPQGGQLVRPLRELRPHGGTPPLPQRQSHPLRDPRDRLSGGVRLGVLPLPGRLAGRAEQAPRPQPRVQPRRAATRRQAWGDAAALAAADRPPPDARVLGTDGAQGAAIALALTPDDLHHRIQPHG